ncbi:MAG: bifunctional enoyl-CoA hydratase/phosphate acetyltransferase [bacterium]
MKNKPIKNFKDLLKKCLYLKNLHGIQKMAVICPYDVFTLRAIIKAQKEKIINSILIGNKDKIEEALKKLKKSLFDFEIINIIEEEKILQKAMELVNSKKVHLIMKGFIQTSTLLKAVLDKEKGIRTEKLISHVSVFKLKNINRLMFMSDGGININPNLLEKKSIIENAVFVAHNLGIKKPRVALLSAVETINLKMESSVEDAILSKMVDRSQIKNVIIDGPLAFDGAMSKKIAELKGIKTRIAGRVDIFIVNQIETGNLFFKMLMYFNLAKGAGIVTGAKVPIVLVSRTDKEEIKFYSIVLGTIISYHKNKE